MYAAKYGAPQLVTTAARETYLIAEGVKRRAGEHWIRSHGIDRTTIAVVSANELSGLTPGLELY